MRVFHFRFQINCNGAKAQNIQVLAMSPDGRELECPVKESGDAYRTTFQPDEPGEWTIAVKHRGQLIQGSPYTCFVFDPNGIKVKQIKGIVERLWTKHNWISLFYCLVAWLG